MNTLEPSRQVESHERADRYLPLDRRRATRFIDDWEAHVAAVLARLRVREQDEVMSRVFQRALRALPDFRGESRLSTWLYRIAWREGLRQVQRERRDDGRSAPLEIAIRRPDGAEDQLRTLERKETAEQVRAALLCLSDRDREVLALRYLEELAVAEVAARLEISATAAKVRSHRALSRLRIVLEDEDV